MNNKVIALITVSLFWHGNAAAEEPVRAICANKVCKLYLTDPEDKVVSVPRGKAFVVNYIFDDSIQVRTDSGGTGDFKDKGDLTIEGDFILEDTESTKKIADYTRVIQAMTTAFHSLPKKRNRGFKIMTKPWEAFSPSDKGVLLKKQTVAIDECGGGPIVTEIYSHGFATYGGGMEDNTYLIRDFAKLDNGITPGMSRAAVIAALGVPMRESQSMLTYAQKTSGEIAEVTGDKYAEIVRLYFTDGKLVAIWLYGYVLC